MYFQRKAVGKACGKKIVFSMVNLVHMAVLWCRGLVVSVSWRSWVIFVVLVPEFHDYVKILA